MSEEKDNTTEIIRDLTRSGSEIKTLMTIGIDYLVIPKDALFIDMDKYRATPRFLSASPGFLDIDSFVRYLETYGIERTIIQGFPDKATQFSAIIDYHEKSAPSWCSHTASLIVKSTPAWTVWTQNNKKRMGQREFAHFIEDNIEDINSDTAGLLQAIKNVKVGGSSATKSRVGTNEESRSKESNIKVEAGLPDLIDLALVPWLYSGTYKIKARPFLHIDESGVQFSYHLINTERALDDAFNARRTQIEHETGKPVLV